MPDIDRIKSFSLDRLLDVDEVVGLAADARALSNEFIELELPVPQWIVNAQTTLHEEIARRMRANDLKRLNELQSTIEATKTQAEKRKDAEIEMSALQKKLGLTSRASTSTANAAKTSGK